MSVFPYPVWLRRRTAPVLAISAYLLAAAAALRQSTVFGIGAAVAIAAAPLAAYAAFASPLYFPYGFYVLLVPFDNLLNLGSLGSLTKILAFVSAAALLLWCMRKRSAAPLPEGLLAYFALTLWITLSALWSSDQPESIQYLSTYAGLGLLYFSLCVFPLRLSQYRVILGFIVAGAIASALYGANAFYHDPALATQNEVVRRLTIRVGDVAIDPNQFSDALLFPFAAVLTFTLRARRIVFAALGLATITLFAAAIALSGSREAFLGLIVIVLYFAFRTAYRTKVLAGAAAIGAFVATVHSSIWLRFASALDTGGSGRLAIWSVSMEAFKHHPFIGYGIGSFQAVYNTFYLTVYQAYSNGWNSAPNSTPLRYLIETGLIGLLLLVYFFVSQFRMLRSVAKTHELYDDRVMLEAALAGLIVVSFSIDLFHYKYAWLLFGMVALLRSTALTTRATASSRLENRTT